MQQRTVLRTSAGAAALALALLGGTGLLAGHAAAAPPASQPAPLVPAGTLGPVTGQLVPSPSPSATPLPVPSPVKAVTEAPARHGLTSHLSRVGPWLGSASPSHRSLPCALSRSPSSAGLRSSP